MKIQMGEKTVDLSKAMPLTIGDVRKLGKDYGVKMADLGSSDVETTHKVILYLARKAGGPGITEDDVDSIAVGTLVEISKFIAENGASVDRPT